MYGRTASFDRLEKCLERHVDALLNAYINFGEI